VKSGQKQFNISSLDKDDIANLNEDKILAKIDALMEVALDSNKTKKKDALSHQTTVVREIKKEVMQPPHSPDIELATE